MKYPMLLSFGFLTLSGLSSMAMAASDITPKHGSASDPISRNYQCFKDGGFYTPGQGGVNIPNEACRKAFLAGDKLDWQRAAIFENWNAYSQNLIGQSTTPPYSDKVPDGQLCSAGMEKNNPANPQRNYSGIDLPSDKWHVSDLVIGKDRKTKLTYRATQTHEPSKWWIYVSKPDFDATSQSLKWGDLMEITIDKVTLEYDKDKKKFEVYPEKLGAEAVKSTEPGTYYIDVTLPEGYPQNQHAIVYIAWERVDSARETFFSCSDVKLKPAN
ncbi:lytic polysaccharide monooxygenase auxiliary activity family 9 protein [Serratia quinivorans]|uniref:lytic polysaccharide monooxygenase auxiliary activity family 9 protein n=1 Tax=Serratia quinivorans TaxID=137545 RepID=UPI0021790B93|nr:lytic polysaccharide monooxygenase auxiliary activity family 9 protein [Serratia quinivorans]CAI0970381.1 Uncharacterized protein conserved in bacteria [Serratia quinivorans]CAI1710891.1 Uncharacterized protein conserved in bacteria [Serratia quinivorans]